MKLGSILLPSSFIIFIEADFPPASEFVARFPKFAMSVEIRNPISLCWGPANLHRL